MSKVLWDTDNDCEATDCNGNAPEIIDGVVYVKESTCYCDPASGSCCGGCGEVVVSYVIGEQFVWREGDKDMSKFDEDFPTCTNCGATMYLRDGCEWPDDPRLCVCDPCAHDMLAKLFEDGGGE